MPALKELKKWYPIFFGVLVILLTVSHIIDLVNLAILAAFICGLSFLLTAVHVKPALDDERAQLYRLRHESEAQRRLDKITSLNNRINNLIQLHPEKAQDLKSQREKIKRDIEIDELNEQINHSMLGTNGISDLKEQKEKLAAESVAEDKDQESPAIILGSSGIYGIVSGLGITDALINYSKCLTKSTECLLKPLALSNLPADFFGILSFNLPYTFRLVGFLVTIIPFIHGAMLTFSNKWYYDKVERESHFGLAFIFFTVVFFHTALFLFVALNIQDFTLFVLILWILMMVNTPWIFVQTLLTKHYLRRNDIFLNEWIILNFNTFAFLFIFVSASGDVLAGMNDNFPLVNLTILLVLFFRSITDYVVGWNDLYNRQV